MAVYKRSYQPYSGRLTPVRRRFLTLPRYSYQQLFSSKFFTGFFAICLLPSLVATLMIYFYHNATVLKALTIPVAELFPIDERFFLGLLTAQASIGFLLTALIGPGLISPDLSNNALPLYLSRPFSRSQYVLGKMMVLAVLLSLITWIPSLLLFVLQSSMAGTEWFLKHKGVAVAILLSAALWIVTVSLLALALSAWVRWKPIAAAAMFGVFFAAAAFGELINGVLYTKWGLLINLGEVLRTVWFWLFLEPGNNMIRIPVWSAALSVAATCGLCLWMLGRKIRAYEVVR
ncbi:MAG: hypothetical protein ACR2L2_13020 [Acidobacteriota bacterium]